MTACDECKFKSMQLMEREYICGHPAYKGKGKRIYRETFGVLKKLGCGGAEKK